MLPAVHLCGGSNVDQEATRIRGLVEAHRPTRQSEGYPDWLRQEVAHYAARVRPTAQTWAAVAATVGLSATTVLRWVGRAAAADLSSTGAAPLPEAAAPSGPAVGDDEGPNPAIPPAPPPRGPVASSSRSCPAPSLGPQQPVRPAPPGATAPQPPTTESRNASTASRDRVPDPRPALAPPRRMAPAEKPARRALAKRARSRGAALVVSPVPVQVVALPDPPSSPGPPGRGGGDLPAGALWLETPGGYRLGGLDLTSAMALLERLQ